jgi:hypothetical protein
MFPSTHDPLEFLDTEMMKLALQETIAKLIFLQTLAEIWPLDLFNSILK